MATFKPFYVALVLLRLTILAYAFISPTQRRCNLFCDDTISFPEPGSPSNTPRSQGLPGKRGQKGEVGECTCNVGDLLEREVASLRLELLDEKKHLPKSCKEIREQNNVTSGVYYVRDSNGIQYPVYCDMESGGGGWTLVASIHENNLGSNGRCTIGDRWSSEHGHNRLGGDGNWQNVNTFGHLSSVTSDDYKNPGYFDVSASDVMIWQVPNDTPLKNISSKSYLRYRTTNSFLDNYGGNLYHLYKDYFPVVSRRYNRATDNGPSPAVVFDKGNAAEVLSHQPPNSRAHVEGGYIQFRVLNGERDAYAICPGLRVKSSHYNSEHSCIGSSATSHVDYCGDFSAMAWKGIGLNATWSGDSVLANTVFLIFYK